MYIHPIITAVSVTVVTIYGVYTTQRKIRKVLNRGRTHIN